MILFTNNEFIGEAKIIQLLFVWFVLILYSLPIFGTLLRLVWHRVVSESAVSTDVVLFSSIFPDSMCACMCVLTDKFDDT